MEFFFLISIEICQGIELISITYVKSRSYTYYLGLFVICDIIEILDDEVTCPKNRNLLTRTIYQKVKYQNMNTLWYKSLSKTPVSKTVENY